MGTKNIILKVIILFPLMILLFLFLPAGSFRYVEAWIFSVALFIPLMTTIIYLDKKDPALLERRLRTQEKGKKQKIIVRILRIPSILGLLIPGLDYRFQWTDIPMWLVIVSNIMIMLGYFLVFLVFRENSYTSRVVEVERDQKVIATGPYSFIRHPMYAGMIVLFLFLSPALGSWWALATFVFVPVSLIFRILDEEKVLRSNLPGYGEYCEKVRYRLVPYIW